MEGRWKIHFGASRMVSGGRPGDDMSGLTVPVVPCDDDAVARVARKLAQMQGYPTGPHALDYSAAEGLLRAACEAS